MPILFNSTFFSNYRMNAEKYRKEARGTDQVIGALVSDGLDRPN